MEGRARPARAAGRQAVTATLTSAWLPASPARSLARRPATWGQRSISSDRPRHPRMAWPIR
eukprot:1533478-Lingulodinium_polyedra.AAC.1